jgi:hypothetical protein
VDMIISAQFGYRFNQDPLQAPKILLVAFTGFITGAVFTETSHHLAQGVLSVEDASGRSIRSYDQTVDVTAESMVSAFAEMKTMAVGPPAAADSLIAGLVQRLIDDRDVFAARRSKPVAAPEPEGSAPAASVGLESSPAVERAAERDFAASEADAPRGREVVQAEPKPISSAEAEEELLP